MANVELRGHATVYGRAHLSGNVCVDGYASVSGGWINGNVHIGETATIYGDATMIQGRVDITGNAVIHDDVNIKGENIRISGYTFLYGGTKLSEDALLESNHDFIVIGPTCYRHSYLTFHKRNDGMYGISGQSFAGTLEDFRKRNVDLSFANINHLYADMNLKICDFAEMMLAEKQRQEEKYVEAE